jgi:hypothetical protein
MKDPRCGIGKGWRNQNLQSFPYAHPLLNFAIRPDDTSIPGGYPALPQPLYPVQ